jgi:hypothetical protein
VGRSGGIFIDAATLGLYQQDIKLPVPVGSEIEQVGTEVVASRGTFNKFGFDGIGYLGLFILADCFHDRALHGIECIEAEKNLEGNREFFRSLAQIFNGEGEALQLDLDRFKLRKVGCGDAIVFPAVEVNFRKLGWDGFEFRFEIDQLLADVPLGGDALSMNCNRSKQEYKRKH